MPTVLEPAFRVTVKGLATSGRRTGTSELMVHKEVLSMHRVIRRIDHMGRVCLPREMRQVLAINEDTLLEIILDSEKMVLKKYLPGCTNCAKHEVFKAVGGVRLCRSCFDILARS
jgi:AbrB family transcriptional regulator, transcriptional pleiotropic regulator of transition state genes